MWLSPHRCVLLHISVEITKHVWENPHRQVLGFFHTCLVKHPHRLISPWANGERHVKVWQKHQMVQLYSCKRFNVETAKLDFELDKLEFLIHLLLPTCSIASLKVWTCDFRGGIWNQWWTIHMCNNLAFITPQSLARFCIYSMNEDICFEIYASSIKIWALSNTTVTDSQGGTQYSF